MRINKEMIFVKCQDDKITFRSEEGVEKTFNILEDGIHYFAVVLTLFTGLCFSRMIWGNAEAKKKEPSGDSCFLKEKGKLCESYFFF